MGIKQLLNIAILLLSVNCFSQTEIQHKYDVKQAEEFSQFLKKSENADAFKTHFHSELVYYDLYFDTPNMLLLEHGMSLRMRKKEALEEEFAYVFQLKSEMTKTSSVRMEVEERELDFYLLLLDGEKTNLAKLLDELFDLLEKNENKENYHFYEKHISAIQKWIVQKAQAPITPFQKLNFLNPEVFSFHTISTLKPLLIGKSKRIRNHIYMEENAAKEVGALASQNDLEKDRPPFFIDNPDKNWVLESSLDSAVFYPLFEIDFSHSTIIEYEVENKLSNLQIGEDLIQIYQEKINSKFGLKATIDSKYVQSMKLFNQKR